VEAWNNHFTPIHEVNTRLRQLIDTRPWLHYVDCGDRFLRPAENPAAQLAPAGEMANDTVASLAAAAVTSLEDRSGTRSDALEAAMPGAAGGSAVAPLDEGGPSALGPLYIEPRLMYDLLHLTPNGYREWAACLLPTVERLMGERGGALGGVQSERSPGDQ
jgi:lysophospholipase L1-like esterase